MNTIMRNLIFFIIAGLTITAFAQSSDKKLNVLLNDLNGDPILYVDVILLDSNGTTIGARQSSEYGCTFTLPKQTSTVRLLATSIEYKKIDTTITLSAADTKIFLTMQSDEVKLEEVVVKTTQKLPTRSVSSIASVSYHIDGTRVSDKNQRSISFSANRSESKHQKTMIEKDRNQSQVSFTEGGQLTAGEIHDFSKWDLWTDIDKTDLSNYQDRWKLYPDSRITFQLINEKGAPVVDQTVYLFSKRSKDTIWESRTDNTGKAELWYKWEQKLSSSDLDFSHLELKLKDDWNIIHKGAIRPINEGITTWTINSSCEMSDLAEIVFVVDATGSMSDEIEYLKSDLLNIVNEMEDLATGLAVNTGAVFYKCAGNDYVTQSSPLSDDLSLTRSFVQGHGAGGGGLEEVEEALRTALDSMNWSDRARSRIIFLILDEPPGHTEIIVQKLHMQIMRASKMGIRIVPVVSSGVGTGSDKSLEYLMRSMALLTNGTYVFLTDDSGIGNKHTRPTTDKFNTEKLNEIFRRLIQQYTFIPQCQEQELALIDTMSINHLEPHGGFPDVSGLLPSDSSYSDIPPPYMFENNDEKDKWKVFPVPTSGTITIEPPKFAESVALTDLSGKLLQLTEKTDKRIRWDLSSYSEGIYFVKVEGKERMETRRIILAR